MTIQDVINTLEHAAALECAGCIPDITGERFSCIKKSTAQKMAQALRLMSAEQQPLAPDVVMQAAVRQREATDEDAEEFTLS